MAITLTKMVAEASKDSAIKACKYAIVQILVDDEWLQKIPPIDPQVLMALGMTLPNEMETRALKLLSGVELPI